MLNKDKPIKTWAIIIISLIVITFAILKFQQLNQPTAEPVNNNQPTAEEPNSQAVEQQLVQDYLTSHLSELSPEPEVLGGKFLMEKIKFLDQQRAVIEYSDGHNLYIARLTYELSHDQPLAITDFTILGTNGQLAATITPLIDDDLAVVAIKKQLADRHQTDSADIQLTVELYDDQHWRGRVSLLSNPDKRQVFLAILNQGQYQIIYEGNPDFPCADLADYNFPEDILPECLL